MRYSDTHKQETRDRVLAVAARSLRAKGPDRLGVAEVMAEAGLTHGGFYAHFKSKDELLAAAVDKAFEDGRNLWLDATRDAPGLDGLKRYIAFYVSAGHRDRIDSGCPIAALGPVFARAEGPAADTFRANVQRLMDAIASRLPLEDEAERRAIAASLLGEMMGSVQLARTVADQAASDAMLKAARKNLRARIDAFA
jgi:TetR/AcrR family transcriptional repressor of nem operon